VKGATPPRATDFNQVPCPDPAANIEFQATRAAIAAPSTRAWRARYASSRTSGFSRVRALSRTRTMAEKRTAIRSFMDRMVNRRSTGFTE